MQNKKGTPEDDGTARREAWMLELPPESTVHLGLGPRQFRATEGPDMSNRSDWTDTPADKLKKQQKLLIEGEPPPNPEEERRKFLINERDKTMEQMIEKCKKSKKHKRDKSLMELHQEKLKKKQKKKDKERGDRPPERRPFDRDVDLQVNRFDEAQRKAIVNKAQLLDTRFSTGESKFL
ncbi:GPALPP motifs-containing protein 1 [Diaphorina citri]|uniref:GPALPP motifs-containing protein 1 n=1 Tax=Diaphorina citri TaxID=121845 RepID=A0A1S3D793_DIACI|nr:GPALPP motifs-containing protein 1 [Diaphorina citri]